MQKNSTIWGVLRFNPRGIHKILNIPTFNIVPRGNPCLGHVAPHNLSINMPRVKISFAHMSTNSTRFPCQLAKSFDTSPTTCEAIPYHVNMYGLYGLYSEQSFFCLANRTERDISLIRCLFDLVQSALGSWRQGLCSCSFWSDSEHFYFGAKFWPLVQIMINNTKTKPYFLRCTWDDSVLACVHTKIYVGWKCIRVCTYKGW